MERETESVGRECVGEGMSQRAIQAEETRPVVRRGLAVRLDGLSGRLSPLLSG